jgi:hypothetical protein
MPSSEDYGGGGGGGSTQSGFFFYPTRVSWSVVQSVTKIQLRNKLCKSIVGDVVSINCFCDIDTINTMQNDSPFTACVL